MDSQQASDKDDQRTNPQGLKEMVEHKFKKIKDHAEAYPYLWASYITVYGGLGLWLTYRWRKLRKTEDRVRALHKRLRELVESQDSPTSSTLEKVPPSIDKSSTTLEKVSPSIDKSSSTVEKVPPSIDKSSSPPSIDKSSPE